MIFLKMNGDSSAFRADFFPFVQRERWCLIIKERKLLIFRNVKYDAYNLSMKTFFFIMFDFIKVENW